MTLESMKSIRDERETSDYTISNSSSSPMTNEMFCNYLCNNHRPLLVTEFMTATEDILTATEDILRESEHCSHLSPILWQVGESLCTQKGILKNDPKSLSSMMIWLSGIWLSSENDERYSSSYYFISPPDLVRGHFFEPAVSVNCRNGNADRLIPCLGAGSKRYHVIGAASIKSMTLFNVGAGDLVRSSDEDMRNVLKEKNYNSDELWLLSLNGEGAITDDFRNVKEAVTLCIQQCLSKEPLLAIALSTAHRLTVKQFKRGIHETFKTSYTDWSLGIMNGELVELIVYAALQQANGYDLKKPNGIAAFIRRLVQYLSPATSVGNPSLPRLKERICREHLNCTVHYDEKKEENLNDCFYTKEENDSEQRFTPNGDMEKFFSQFGPIPWLVPAATGTHFTGYEDISTMLGALNVAALVPGRNNDRLDIKAYQWPPLLASPETLWKFEVRARRGYDEGKAWRDLRSKCKDESDSPGRFHAMLIGVRDGKTKIYAGKNKNGHLRIVILISSCSTFV